ncbi:serine hydrolase domain-containing protein [Thalassotalea marina]|uniref:Serine hydrolase n=1 Tax=Thalassotalea marina TaxID=1673741 RepID=A0A919BE89_9GAMM|nr:serine hydrolase domain-containing protein [Thalassotalea marina]GHF82952.1 serine hydrolase [Thalassotalea marina]
MLKKLKITSFIFPIALSTLLATQVQANEVDQLIKNTMQERKIPGLQLAVVKHNKIIKQGYYGVESIATNKPVTKDSIFTINSMTKAFTGVAAIKLVEQGKLQLSDTLDMHLENLPNAWQKMTVQQVFSHTSGLPRVLSGKGVELIGDGTSEGAWQAVQKLPVKFEANSRFQYNQTGYAILGKIIEKHYQQPFVKVLEQQFVKANMPLAKHYSFTFDQQKLDTLAQQYLLPDGNNLQEVEVVFEPLIYPAAGMATNVSELANFIAALKQGEFFAPELLKDLWAPAILNNGKTEGFNSRENGYAAGWQVIDRKVNPAISASGGDANTIIIYPEKELTIIVLTNLIGGLPIEFVDDIAQYY